MDPLQAMLTGGWPLEDADDGPGPLPPPAARSGPAVVVLPAPAQPVGQSQVIVLPAPAPAAYKPPVVVLPTPRPPVVFPAQPQAAPAPGGTFPQSWTKGSPDTAVRGMRQGVATHSPFPDRR